MAQMGRDPAAPGPVVKGFAEGGFAIEGQVYPAVLLTPSAALAWSAPSFEALEAGDLEPVLSLDPAPEFLVLGTGPTLRFPPKALRDAIEDRGIGLEVMDSRAAARIWGLLRGEERWIAAALLPL